MTKKTRWYTMTVLAYYRSEWTDVPDDDKSYRLLVTEELQQLIKTCMRRGVSVPNAAKEVEIFLDLQEARANSERQSGSSPTVDWHMELKPKKNPLWFDPKPSEKDDDADA
jgi:hypothetical protein